MILHWLMIHLMRLCETLRRLLRDQQCQLALSDENSKMLVKEGIALGHYISIKGIKMDLAKVALILTTPTLKKQKDVRSFLHKVGFY